MSNEFLRAPDPGGSQTTETVTSTLADEPSPLANWWETPKSEYRKAGPFPYTDDDDKGGYASTLTDLIVSGRRDASAGTGSGKTRTADRAVDEGVDAITGEIDRATKDSPAADENTQRAGLVGRILAVPPMVMQFIENGNHDGLEMIQPEEAPPSSGWASFLAFAASMAVGGIAGSAAVLIGDGLASAIISRPGRALQPVPSMPSRRE